MAEKNITLKDVDYVSKLARLSLTDQEEKLFQDQLEEILEYMSILKSVDTSAIEPTAHPLKLSTVWREDVAKPFAAVSELLKNAPEAEEKFYRVKKVIEG